MRHSRVRNSVASRARGEPGRLWYGEPSAVSNAVDYAKFRSRSHDAVIRVYDTAGKVIEAHEQAGAFKKW